MTGSLIIRVTASRADIPVQGASVAVTTPDGDGRHTLIFLLETDQNGIAGPVTLPVPTTESNGTQPGGPAPYAFYSLWVEHPGYQVTHVQEIQVFPGIESVQNITLIPLSSSSFPPNRSDTISGAEPQPL